VAVWGNAAPKPNCTFQAQPIPGSRKLVFIASAHHAITGGPVCLLDPGVDPNSLEAITRVTAGPFPEAESGNIPEYYQSPWPLSETLFLVAYSRDRLIFEGEQMHNPNPDNALGLYLLDRAGNRELIYRDPQIGSTCPIPLRGQPRPPALPSAAVAGAAPQGELLVVDVYQGLGNVARGSIKELRIVQIFPKTTWLSNSPRIGIAGEENARAILGTVPVRPDGSARFLAPAHKPLLFQALDAQGNAYQTMRSTTSVQPGEHTSCVGCHEHRMSAPPAPQAGSLLALRQAPTPIDPGELGGRPFSFVAVVQPVLDRQCVRCHGGEKTEQGIDLTATAQQGFTRSYWSLCGVARGKPGEAPREPLVPRFAMRNQIQMTPPGGAVGARGSRLMKLLRGGHAGVQLSDGDLRRLAAWIDCNAVFSGSFATEEQGRQLTGQPIPMPAVQ
jgi:cytochrome c553